MSLLGYQRAVRDVLLAVEPRAEDVRALGHEPWRWLAYRRMVRARFRQTIEHAFDDGIAAAGAERFDPLIERFLELSPPRSPYLRDVPGELLGFVEPRWPALREELGLPEFTLDFMRYEWTELAVAYSEGSLEGVVGPLDMERPALLSPSFRRLDLAYAVHRWEPEAGRDVAREPVSLALYRDPATHDVETLELAPLAARFLAGIAARSAPLSAIARNAAADLRVEVDVPFVEALSELLADLLERGVLLGSLADTEKSE